MVQRAGSREQGTLQGRRCLTSGGAWCMHVVQGVERGVVLGVERGMVRGVEQGAFTTRSTATLGLGF